VDVTVKGFIASVTSRLVFKNTESQPIEAVYEFPIDDQSAVFHFEAEIDGRTIIAECQEKKQVRLYVLINAMWPIVGQRNNFMLIIYVLFTFVLNINTIQNPGPQRGRHLTSVVWHDHSTRHLFAGPLVRASFTPVHFWSNPVAVADLLQLWTNAQGAAGGGARSGLN